MKINSVKKMSILAFLGFLAIGFFGLAVVTILPTDLLPWNVHNACLLGYEAGCSFAPISTIILLVLATASILGIRRIWNTDA